jgi:DnaK suppressor protein
MDPNEIERYRERLREMQYRLEDEFHRIAERVIEDIRAPGELSRIPTHPADSDTEGLQQEIALEKTEGQLLDQVRMALQRIDEGTFGQCVDCGEPIAAERLDALPQTPRCIDCERSFESGT